jgi:Cd2+/Zn2+-exporting ATPase
MNLHDAFYRSTVLLVVASPCAVLLATPSAILSAIGHGARAGALFKGGVFVERLGEVKAAAFDKTGILTSGVPRVFEIDVVSGTEANLVRDAVSLEHHSTHPLAAAVTAAARERKVAPAPVTGLTMHQGLGLSAMLDGGRLIWVGSETFAATLGVAVPTTLLEPMAAHREAGRMTVLVGQGDRVSGLIAIADVPRPGAAAAITALRGQGIHPLVMMTGDHRTVGERLGRELGLDEVMAGLLPDEKLKAVTALTERVGPVVMVGDGVNDGPALAAAHVGVTLGMASEVALEVADVVLVTNDLSRLPYAIALARKARRVIVQNLVFASAVILCGIGLALAGSVSLPYGVILHEGSTLLVVANGLRLLLPLKP